ncbi:MAG: hypothetical protein QXI71_02195 [Candidatus Bathyarchaeia archaeon]
MSEVINWENKIENILKNIKITDEDFRRKGRLLFAEGNRRF